jgi:hypothetical protein
VNPLGQLLRALGLERSLGKSDSGVGISADCGLCFVDELLVGSGPANGDLLLMPGKARVF